MSQQLAISGPLFIPHMCVCVSVTAISYLRSFIYSHMYVCKCLSNWLSQYLASHLPPNIALLVPAKAVFNLHVDPYAPFTENVSSFSLL